MGCPVRFLFPTLYPYLYLRYTAIKNDKFYGNSLNRLVIKQIDKIVEIVEDEVEKTRKHGHSISQDDIDTEKFFFLSMINKTIDIYTPNLKISFDDLFSVFGKMMKDFFTPLTSKYFQNTKSGVKNWYGCHLDSLKGRLLNALYNGEIPYIKPQ